MRRSWPILSCAAALFAQSSTVESGAALAHTKELVKQRIGQLPKYTCTALINRTYLRVTRGAAGDCDRILGNRRKGVFATKPTATDCLRLEVEITDTGNEIFSWPDAAKFDAMKVEDMADGGPIGTGSFGSFIIDIFSNPATQFVYQGRAGINGANTLEYRFRVPAETSHYRVGANGGAYRFVGYDGSLWIDPASSELVRIEVRTGELLPETGACEATTRVDLQRLHLGQGEYLAPERSVLGVVGRYGSDSESVTTYSACHEFRGESSVSFGEPGINTSAPVASRTAGAVALPAGVPVFLAFVTPIDTDVTAAGDPLIARVAKSVFNPVTKKSLLPAGTLVRGRVVHMEHVFEDRDGFILSVMFDEPHLIPNRPGQIMWADKTTPCGESRRGIQKFGFRWETNEQVESKGQLSLGGSFLLPSHAGRYVMPQGCVSEWLTTK